MDRCSAIARPPGRLQGARRQTGGFWFGGCGEVIRPAHAATVRVNARLGCCGVHKAEVAERTKDPILRPEVAKIFENEDGQVSRMAEDGIDGTKAGVCIRVSVARAVGLPKADFLGLADPYVELRGIAGNPLDSNEFKPQEVRKHKSKAIQAKTMFEGKTAVVRGSLAPSWEESFDFQLPNAEALDGLHLYFRVYDYDQIKSDDCLGHISINLLDALVSCKELSVGWRSLLTQTPQLCDRIQFLRDAGLPSQTRPLHIQPLHGQETTYDLREAQLFIAVDVVQPTHSAGVRTSDMGRLPRPRPPAYVQHTRASAQAPASAAAQQLSSELIKAAEEGDVPAVFRAIRVGGTDVNSSVADGEFPGCTPLHIACLKGHSDLAQVLVELLGASLVQSAPGGRSPAMCACQAGDAALAEWLIREGVPADLRDDQGGTVLWYAAKAALPSLTSWLVAKQRLQVDYQTKGGSTPLTAAVTSGAASSASVVQLLLGARADANRVNGDGNAPLHLACEAGEEQCVRVLLGFGGAKASALDGQGRTTAELAKAASLPKALVARLSNTITKEAKEAVVDGSEGTQQQLGESAEEARKRELREHRAKLSDENSPWQAWRAMHPRPGPRLLPDSGAGVGDISSISKAVEVDADADNFEDLFASPTGDWKIGKFFDEVPEVIGLDKGHSNPPTGSVVKRPGRIGRLKGWAISGIRRRRQGNPGPPERQDSWSSLGSLPSRDSPRF